jgi:diguanylate cyclase (GGDEF)-like protein
MLINGLPVLAMMCLHLGFGLLARARLSFWRDAGTPLGLLVLCCAMLWGCPNEVGGRLLAFALAMVWPAALMGMNIRRMFVDLGKQVYFWPLAFLPLVAFSAILLYRPIAKWTKPYAGNELLLVFDSDFQTLFVFVVLLCLALFNLCSAVIVITRLVRRLHKLSSTDVLTELANRRFAIDALNRLQGLYRRGGGGFSVLILDVDHFKRVNDKHGHAAGDAALKSVAQSLKRNVRVGDLPARFGGEEFLVLLPGADDDEALAQAERLRACIQSEEIAWGDDVLTVTTSIGLSAVRPTDERVDEVLARADKALYQAKGEGRNRVVRATLATETLWQASQHS